VTAWHGIRMVRDLNVAYVGPLKPIFPPARLGPAKDSPKVGCATCHQGVFKPLYGVSMAKDFLELQHPSGGTQQLRAEGTSLPCPGTEDG
jgi:photosynthetic reaction center cytochrome c subunit